MAGLPKKPRRKAGGPYLAAAIFCESVMEGADQALTAIRIVDQITLTIPKDAPPDIPSEQKRLPASICALVTFRRGDAKRKHVVRLVMNSPSGKRETVSDHRITLSDKAHGGANLRINMTFGISKGGLFWVDVILDGKLVTRMPLQITVVRSDMPPSKGVATGLLIPRLTGPKS
jgi:hypothetical protein